MSERLLTQPRALADYARQLLFPNGPSLGIYHDDFQKSVLAGPDGGGTGLGRIGFGYVYPDFRTRFTYKTPDINGFNLEVGIFDPQETGDTGAETDTPQFQAEATYTHGFDNGSFNAWFGLLWQEQEITSSALGGTGDVNVQEEQVQKLDVFANRVIIERMQHVGQLCCMGSEEIADLIEIPARYPKGNSTFSCLIPWMVPRTST